MVSTLPQLIITRSSGIPPSDSFGRIFWLGFYLIFFLIFPYFFYFFLFFLFLFSASYYHNWVFFPSLFFLFFFFFFFSHFFFFLFLFYFFSFFFGSSNFFFFSTVFWNHLCKVARPPILLSLLPPPRLSRSNCFLVKKKLFHFLFSPSPFPPLSSSFPPSIESPIFNSIIGSVYPCWVDPQS